MTFPSAPPPLDGVAHDDVVVGGTRWHVASAGRGSPVVLLHGWPQHWWMWRKIIPDLARTHRVIAPDFRGSGWSDAPPGSYSKTGLAADVETLLDELGVGSCTLVGHDWGALTGFFTAIRAPRRVERLVALSNINPWPRRTNLTPKAALAITYQFPIATPLLGEYLQRFGARVLGELLARSVARGFSWDPEDLSLYTEQWRRPGHARAASALYRTFLTREAPALFAGRYARERLEMPIVHATGRHDPVVTPARIEGGEENAPLMRKAIIEDAGHFVAEERPDQVLALIREEPGS